MKLLQLLFLLFFLCNAADISWPNFQQTVKNATFKQFRFSNKEVKQAFEKFKLDFNRVYETEKEEEQKFSAFIDNFMFVKKVNYLYAQGRSPYSTIINQFSDLTKSEMEENKQCIQTVEPHRMGQHKMFSNYSFNPALPKNLDWRDYNYVTPVKNEGFCRSCYAFAAIESLESQAFRKTGKLLPLSVQQIIDCAPGLACRGGSAPNVYEYIRDTDGINADADYPYVSGRRHGGKHECKFNRNKMIVKIHGYVKVTPPGDEEMLKYVVATVGSISVSIEANHKEFFHYHEGILEIPTCKNKTEYTDHCIVIIGYGVEHGIPYWLVKNSWDPHWGSNGIGKIRRNANNMCGIASFVYYPLVK